MTGAVRKVALTLSTNSLLPSPFRVRPLRVSPRDCGQVDPMSPFCQRPNSGPWVMPLKVSPLNRQNQHHLRANAEAEPEPAFQQDSQMIYKQLTLRSSFFYTSLCLLTAKHNMHQI